MARRLPQLPTTSLLLPSTQMERTGDANGTCKSCPPLKLKPARYGVYSQTRRGVVSGSTSLLIARCILSSGRALATRLGALEAFSN